MNCSIEGNVIQKVYSGWISFHVPENIVTIKSYCFEDCKLTIESIIFDGRNIKQIEERAFDRCAKLKTLDLRDCPLLNSVGGYFLFGTGLTEVFFPSNCPVSWDGYEKSMIESFVTADDHNTLTSIDGVVYSKGMTVLYLYPPRKAGSTFTIPSGITAIGGCAFVDSYYLRHISFPKSCKSIDNWAFLYSKIVSLYIPDTIESIGSNTFYACYNLINVEIHAKLDTIQAYTFINCYKLSDIFISGEPKVGANAFSSCNSLGTIHAAETTKAEILKQINYKPKRNVCISCKSKGKTNIILLLVFIYLS